MRRLRTRQRAIREGWTVYSGIDDPKSWVLARVIEEQAHRRPDDRLVSIVDGEALTYARFAEEVAKVAGFLSGLGVEAGQRIAILMPNGLDFLRAWAGVQRLGATAVLLNTELIGSFLAHPINDAAPGMIILDQAGLARVLALEVDLPSVRTMLVPGSPPPGTGQIASFDGWRAARPFEGPFPAASDIACIMYTSGTTGAPKGVLMPHAHCFLFGLGVTENLGITAEDHYYICLPLFHANALLMQFGAVLIAGAGATVRERFSSTAWLRDVQACGATVTHSLGAISAFVIARPEQPDDRNHRLRLMFSAPNHPDHERVWRERFGIAEVVGGYGMTECNIPLYGDRHDPRPGACGKAYGRCFEVEIRDPVEDLPVPVGEVGEIMVRPRIAHAFMAGYNGLPEKTVEAWRNLWFHTGDAAWMSADGYVTFVDRIKDCIRRRGENISATDIEAIFARLEGVAEIAAFAVPSDIEGGEDEIMIAIVPASPSALAPAAILEHARRTLPKFAQPRYVVFRTALPKTGTEKVRKTELRLAGVTEDTIDLTDPAFARPPTSEASAPDPSARTQACGPGADQRPPG